MPNNNQVKKDPIAAAILARAEDDLLVQRRARFYGCLAFINLIAFALVLKGMPLHYLWEFIGPILGISLLFISTSALHYGIMHLANSFEDRKAQR